MRAYQHFQLPAEDQGEPATYAFYTRAELLKMHAKFVHAMLRARKAGKERFVLGVSKDDDTRDLVPTPFSRVQCESGMGSSASMMVDDAVLGGFVRHGPRLGLKRE